MEKTSPPLVAHIVNRFAVGGLENGLVNLINHMPEERYRHAVICLTDCTDFCNRIRRPDVSIFTLQKRNGHVFGLYARLLHTFGALCPDIVHTRNLSALECLIPAALARVPGRIHGEHGRDVYDLEGLNIKYNLIRKAVRPFAHHYTAVSGDLARWLVHTIGIRGDRVTHISNGVDTQRFSPRSGTRSDILPEGFAPSKEFVVGTAGRMQTVKDHLTLVRAFLRLQRVTPQMHGQLRLVIVGDGPLRQEAQQLLRTAGAESLAWLPGERSDVSAILQSFDLFVLPSLAEGISNTILEAMASGLPVIATRVGGNPELVQEGLTGMLVPPADPVAMAKAMRSYVVEREKLGRHGQAGRKRVEEHFSIERMINGYLSIYDMVLEGKRNVAHTRRLFS